MSFERDLDRAWDRLEEGDVRGARRLAEKLAGAEPEAPDLLLLLAACEREEGNLDEALARLVQASAADPEWATPRLWTAELLAGDPERLREALEQAGRALELAEEPEELLEAIALKAGLEMDLGKKEAARRTLADLPPPEAAGMPSPLALELAHLFLAIEDPAEARRRFQAVAAEEPEVADAWFGLGLAAEGEGDEEGKRAAWLKTLALDEKTKIEDPLLSEAEMGQAAEAALAELPERARALIRNVPILIVDLPARADVERGLDPRLLGLFDGTAYPDASSLNTGAHLTQILLFRKNLERAAHDVDELRDEIRTTLLHETGHFFGMSEEDLAEVGLD